MLENGGVLNITTAVITFQTGLKSTPSETELYHSASFPDQAKIYTQYIFGVL